MTPPLINYVGSRMYCAGVVGKGSIQRQHEEISSYSPFRLKGRSRCVVLRLGHIHFLPISCVQSKCDPRPSLALFVCSFIAVYTTTIRRPSYVRLHMYFVNEEHHLATKKLQNSGF